MEDRSGLAQRVDLRDNDIEDLQLRIFSDVATVAVQLDSASIANGVKIFGSATVTVTD